MHTEDELLKYAKELDIDCVNVSYENENKNKILYLKMRDIFGVIDFAKKKGIDTIFYEYIPFEQESFKIYEETIDYLNYNSDEYNFIKDKIEAYNDSIDEEDFDKPITLNGYCIYQGQMIGVIEID
ncbi:hypothetical protein [Clostridium arbusti]|uniref:hypothetical protein n=1 Tax=Clostridium arbusti TaxID=1137848 RepID=UPI00028A04BC|nr:hypothetical protein [Clostridium arbusti]